jgi:hypothetical protein
VCLAGEWRVAVGPVAFPDFCRGARDSWRATHLGHTENQFEPVVPRLKCRQGERVREDVGNTVNRFKTIVVGDGRRPRHRVAGEYYQLSLWKWNLGSDGVLDQQDGHKLETTSPQVKWGTTPGNRKRVTAVKRMAIEHIVFA